MKNRFSHKRKIVAKVQRSRHVMHRENGVFTPGVISSFLNKVDLKCLLKPAFFNLLSYEGRMNVEQFLPKCDRAFNEDLLMCKDSGILSNVYFNLACKQWMENLKEGSLNNYLKKLSIKLSRSKKLRNSPREELCRISDENDCQNGLELAPDPLLSLVAPLVEVKSRRLQSEETDYGEEDSWFSTPCTGSESEEGSGANAFHRWRFDYSEMSCSQRCHFEAALLDHGCYFRPSELQVAVQNTLKLMREPPPFLPIGSTTSSCNLDVPSRPDNSDCPRFDLTPRHDFSSQTVRSCQFVINGVECKAHNKPHFVRVILHRRSGHGTSSSRSGLSLWDSSPSMINGRRASTTFGTKDLVDLVQRLVSSDVRLPCLMPFPSSSSSFVPCTPPPFIDSESVTVENLVETSRSTCIGM